MKPIDKSTLVAEIKRRIKEHKRYANSNRNNMIEEDVAILSFIDSLEVKEVDLGIEICRYIGEHFNVYDDGNQTLQTKDKKSLIGRYDAEKIAKYFFELGIKAQKGE